MRRDEARIGAELPRRRDQVQRRKERIFRTSCNIGGAIADKRGEVHQGIDTERAKAGYWGTQ